MEPLKADSKYYVENLRHIAALIEEGHINIIITGSQFEIEEYNPDARDHVYVRAKIDIVGKRQYAEKTTTITA